MNLSLIRQLWYYTKWPLIAFLVVFAVFVGWRVVVLNEQDVTAEAVAAIHANKLTWQDINGELPAQPDEAANTATLAGVDSNHNGIRDDVEIAIYTKYKSTPGVAVAMLQYAKALQMEFTRVYNSETLVAVIQEQDRGSTCVLDLEKVEEVDELVLNTSARKEFSNDLYEKYTTFYSLPNKDFCDIVL